MASANSGRTVDYVLIGGGLASATAAEEIRKRDANGSILLVSNDSQIPYHRPPLSKEYLRGEIEAEGVYGEGGVYVHVPTWYGEQHVELAQTEATKLDTSAKTVTLASGETVHYGKLLLATGGRARMLDLPGKDLPGVYTLRTFADSNALRDELKEHGRRVVVIGSSFIGLEVTANALFRHAEVSIVEASGWPLAQILPPALGQYLRQQFERRGTATYYSHAPTEFVAGEDGRVASVRVMPRADASAVPQDLPCDLVVVGVGVQLNTELAQAAGLEVDPKQGIVVDERLQASAPDVYAAGDIAAYPDPVMGRMHFEHWDNAVASGQTVAANMTGANEPYQHVPYFFSDQFDLSLNMLGYPAPDQTVVVRGDLGNDQFTSLLVKDGVLRAVLMINDDAQMDLLRDLVEQQVRVPDAEQLRDPNFDLASLKASSQEGSSTEHAEE